MPSLVKEKGNLVNGNGKIKKNILWNTARHVIQYFAIIIFMLSVGNLKCLELYPKQWSKTKPLN